MTSMAVAGLRHSNVWLAAKQYNPTADLSPFPNITKALETYLEGSIDQIILPIYNTNEGTILSSLLSLKALKESWWIDNIVTPINFSLGSLDTSDALSLIVGQKEGLDFAEKTLSKIYPDIPIMKVPDLNSYLENIKSNNLKDQGIIESENFLQAHHFHTLKRDLSPHTKERYAIIGKQLNPKTGYDATAVMTSPLRDRVGLLYDILSEFTKHGLNLIDMCSETDTKTQKLQVYFEIEGHIDDPEIKDSLKAIEEKIFQKSAEIKFLGSYPRVNMRPKKIRSYGIIGTGKMSTWFSKRLIQEGYKVLLSGRSTELRPKEMITQVDVVMICVPISKTEETIRKYAPLMKDKQALILLAGEAENILKTSISNTTQGVEVMLVHNLWGPATQSMKDKNASIVRTSRSGALCNEFEEFLYKHGAKIIYDSPETHDIFMGVGQKLPTLVSLAMAMSLKDNKIDIQNINDHSTLTSLYPILSMSRIHSQNPRTYSEILCTKGASRRITSSFIQSITQIIQLIDQNDIDGLNEIFNENRFYLTNDFLEKNLKMSKSVDQVLGNY